jgi:hypothetical protein
VITDTLAPAMIGHCASSSICYGRGSHAESQGGCHEQRSSHFEYFSIQDLAILTASSGVSQVQIMLRARSVTQVVSPT